MGSIEEFERLAGVKLKREKAEELPLVFGIKNAGDPETCDMEWIFVEDSAMRQNFTISRDNLLLLIELATDALDVRDQEFSSFPTEKEYRLMVKMYALVGKEIPASLRYTFRRFEMLDKGATDDGRTE